MGFLCFRRKKPRPDRSPRGFESQILQKATSFRTHGAGRGGAARQLTARMRASWTDDRKSKKQNGPRRAMADAGPWFAFAKPSGMLQMIFGDSDAWPSRLHRRVIS